MEKEKNYDIENSFISGVFPNQIWCVYTSPTTTTKK